MTKAATIKATVEQLWDAGETVPTIAERLNISHARASQIVDQLEPAHELPAIHPDYGPGNGHHPYDTDRVAALAARNEGTTPVTRGTRRAHRATGKRQPSAKHGTESGYRAHKRRGEAVCDPCREAVRAARLAAYHRNKALKASA